MLSKMQQLREEREEGFTLIELLVVILIIGILSAIAIPAFLNQRKSAVDASVQSDVKNAAIQVETLLIKAPSAGFLSSTTSEATVTITAKQTESAATNLGTITTKISDGTVLTVTGDPFSATGYVIEGTNPGGDKANTNTGYVYKSNTGGLAK